MTKSNYYLHTANCAESVSLHVQLFPELTPKEYDCLYWLYLGRTRKQIASLMKVSDDMIKQRIKKIKKKLNAENIENPVDIVFIYHREFQIFQQNQTNLLISLLLKSKPSRIS